MAEKFGVWDPDQLARDMPYELAQRWTAYLQRKARLMKMR